MAAPRSVRFDPDVLDRLNRILRDRPGHTVSSLVNRLVDEGLRMSEHPGVTFRDGPSGRRAALINGPDIWEVAAAVKEARAADPNLDPDAVVEMVAETTSVPANYIVIALRYWAAYPSEINERVAANDAAAGAAFEQWRRERDLLVS